MAQDDHATLDTLSDYIEAPQAAGFAGLRAHLAACSHCRSQAAGLTRARQALRSAYPAVAPSAVSEEDARRVADQLEGRLYGSEAQAVAQRIAEDGGTLKAALHYATHSAAMRRQLPRESHPAVQSAPAPQTQGLLRTLASWFAWRPPAWISIAATAALTLAVLALLRPWGAAEQHAALLVAAYQDETVMTFSAPTAPGIGFFGSARGEQRAYAPVEVTIASDGALGLRWPPVERAQGYVLDLYRIEGEGRVALGQHQTRETAARFPAPDLQPGRRYEWVLSGMAGDGQAFRTTGGFVIRKRD